VCLCRGGGLGGVSDRQELLWYWNPELFQQIGQFRADFRALNNGPALAQGNRVKEYVTNG
jgi:hypothetical protein